MARSRGRAAGPDPLARGGRGRGPRRALSPGGGLAPPAHPARSAEGRPAGEVRARPAAGPPARRRLGAGARARTRAPLLRRRGPRRSPRPRPVLPSGTPGTRFPGGPDWPGPQSQSLSRSYGSRLPISLTHIILSTRGSEPRRPDAEMGTGRVETGPPPRAARLPAGQRSGLRAGRRAEGAGGGFRPV